MLIHGDCFQVMKDIESGSVDMILTDPPYHSTNLKFDKEDAICYESFFNEVKRVLKVSGVFVSFADLKLANKLMETGGFKTAYELVWSKTMGTGFLNANIRPLRAHEYIVVMMDGLKLSTYNPQKTKGDSWKKDRLGSGAPEHYNMVERNNTENQTGDRHPKSVITFSNGNHKSLHPTAKPINLCEWILKTYSNEDETVLDMFMGAGSVGVAARNLNRRFLGIEKDIDYFNIAKKRIEGNEA